MNDNVSAPAQRSLDWFRARLGIITGSRAGVLIGKGRGSEFTATAQDYFEDKSSERTLNPKVVSNDELFTQYLSEVGITSKAMRIGEEREPEARRLYARLNKVTVEEVPLVIHPAHLFFGSSPDGVIRDDSGNMTVCIEIKCPHPKKHFGFTLCHTPEELKRRNAEYYWQCLSHMAVTGALRTDFVSYHPLSQRPLHILPIRRTPEVEQEISLLIERVIKADQYISDLVIYSTIKPILRYGKPNHGHHRTDSAHRKKTIDRRYENILLAPSNHQRTPL